MQSIVWGAGRGRGRIVATAVAAGLGLLGTPAATVATADAAVHPSGRGAQAYRAPALHRFGPALRFSPAELRRAGLRSAERAAAASQPAGLSGPAPACYGDSRQIAPVGGTLDPSSYGAFYNCQQQTWTFEVGTADTFASSTFGGWFVSLDTDGNFQDDCGGYEYGAVVEATSPGTYVGAVLQLDANCNGTEVGAATISLTPNGVALSFPSSAIQDAGTVAWNGDLASYSEVQSSTTGDQVPSSSFVDYPAQGAVLDSVPPASPPSCQLSAGSSEVATTPDAPAAAAALRKAGIAGVHAYSDGLVAFNGTAATASKALAAAHLPSSVSAARNYTAESLAVPGSGTTTAPNDPKYASQWNLKRVNAPSAWSVTTGAHILVADIDTGADYTHSDLPSPQLVGGIDETASTPTPINYTSGDTDTDGHGTAVAGVIAAATNNGIGLSSLGWNTSVMPVKVGSNGTFTSAALAAGIEWAADHGARVINLSLGSPCTDSALASAITYAQDKGALIVAAAGNGAINSGLDPNNGYDDSPTYPAAYPGVLAVGATGTDGYRAAYSNTGSYVSLVAPGGDLNGANDGIEVLQPGGTYAQEVGTSFAAPEVAAAAALILSVNPGLTASQVSELLTGTATDTGPTGTDIEYGAGLLNAGAALADTPPTTAGFGTYTSLSPTRILDTRSGLGAPKAPVAGGSAIDLTVDGAGGIPSTGVAAVVLNVTVANPTAGSYVTVWPAGQPRPNASNINFQAKQAVPNLVTVKVGSGGRVSLYNAGGNADLVADVAGYYGDGTGAAGSTYVPVSPQRLLDTRTNGGPVGAGASRTLQIAGSGTSGVPTSATAVVLNVTAAAPSLGGYLTVYPAGGTRPTASNLNFTKGETVPNLVTVQLGPTGAVGIYNYAGTTQVIVDLAGYYTAAGDTSGSRFFPLVDDRILDTRHDIGGYFTPISAGSSISVGVTGQGGVIDGATGVVMNTTATGSTLGGYLTVYPAGQTQPTASNLNFTTGETVANLVSTKLGTAGAVTILSAADGVDVLADVAGWFGPAGS